MDNGWTVGTDELIKLFELLDLRSKVIVSEEFSAFIEFCILLAMLLKVDAEVVEKYFSPSSQVVGATGEDDDGIEELSVSQI